MGDGGNGTGGSLEDRLDRVERLLRRLRRDVREVHGALVEQVAITGDMLRFLQGINEQIGRQAEQNKLIWQAIAILANDLRAAMGLEPLPFPNLPPPEGPDPTGQGPIV
jgi:hypothetical protein